MKTTYEAAPNERIRRFTIRAKENGVTIIKYRTLPMGRAEFEDAKHNTSNDWKHYVNTNPVSLVK